MSINTQLMLCTLVVASIITEINGAECTSTKPDKRCKKTVESVFGKRDTGMSGPLSCKGKKVYRNSLGTGYYPAPHAPEGGCVDMRGKPLRTLQDYLAGRVDYVSVAMDKSLSGPGYGTEICIPQLNKKYKKRIRFKLVDHGPSFDGRRGAKIDICTRTAKDSCSSSINRKLTVYFQ